MVCPSCSDRTQSMEKKWNSPLFFLWPAALTALAGLAALLFWYVPGSIPYDHVSGIMAASAEDIARGWFYRPLFDGAYCGGTRYMPLFSLLHSSLLGLVGDPVTSGRSLVLASFLLWASGLYQLLRTMDVRGREALPFTLLPLASVSLMLLTLAVKCDFLAGGLNLWGLVFVLRGEKEDSAAWISAGALSLAGAFFTKLTTLNGAAAVLIYLLLQRRYKKALWLALLLCGLAVAGLWAIHAASGGRAWEAFLACATGGMDWAYALCFPFWFVLTALADPFFTVILILAVFSAVRQYPVSRRTFPLVYFGVTLLSTAIMFASPGTDGNHLLDLLAASVMVLAVGPVRELKSRRITNWGLGFLTLLIVASWLPGTPSIRSYIEKVGRPLRADIARMAVKLGTGPEEILSENPLLPLLLDGRRPVVLDCFQLRLVAGDVPAVEASLKSRLEERRFRAVILMDWSGAGPEGLAEAMAGHSSLGGKRFYGDVHFFPWFLDVLWKNYRLSFVIGPYVVFQPRRDI